MAPIVPIAPIVLILVRVIAVVLSKRAEARGGTASGPRRASQSPSSIVWWVAASLWGFWAFAVLLAALVTVAGEGARHDELLLWIVVTCVTGVLLFCPWPLLAWSTRWGKPKLVYYLARALCIFPISGQARSGACLLAALTLARRGNVTVAELEWIERRLERETRGLGPFGAAYGLNRALRARVAFDAGNAAEGQRLREEARAIFGTMTYLAEVTSPRSIRRLTWEYLGLDDARLGHWGSLERTQEKELTPLAFVLREWTRERLMNGQAHPKTRKLRARLRSPALDRLFERAPSDAAPSEPRDVWHRARRTYLTLVRGRRLGPRAALNMLTAFDMFTHPRSPHTIVPEAIREKEDLVDLFHEEISEAMEGALRHEVVPLYVLQVHGPISARVHQRVEMRLLDELDRTLGRVEAESENPLEARTTIAEWLTASRTRIAFRRVEHSLGPDAAAAAWPRYAHVYCNYGVRLAETTPRMRPLAHAVFKSLHTDAERFGDQAQLTQQAHNMRVTAGVD